MFLKRTLTDLRAVWTLLMDGYTSAAAAVAAALYEHALAVSAVAGHPDRSKEVIGSPLGDLPWSPTRLAQLLAEQESKVYAPGTEADLMYERTWRETYGGYKFLCKIKHPTMRHSVPALGNTDLGDGEFVVMAAPDNRPQDVPLKATVLMIATTRSFDAVNAFGLARRLRVESSQYKSFDAKMTRVGPALRLAFQSATASFPLPFHIGDEKVGREYREIRKGRESDG
jgi:hypothetical protein